MRLLLLFFFVVLFFQPCAKAQFSERGYPEHFAAGVLISGGVSYYTFKKTDDKVKAWIFGFSASALTGFLKEVVDPVFLNSTRNWTDFAYTALGGAVGASIIIPIKSKKSKEQSMFMKDPFTGRTIHAGAYYSAPRAR